MANDPHYEVVLSRARVHLPRAWGVFEYDPAIPWGELHGNVPLVPVRVRMWIDALKTEIAHFEQLERLHR